MPDYYDPVTKKWSFERGDPDWHWPFSFILIVAGTLACVGTLLYIIASSF